MRSGNKNMLFHYDIYVLDQCAKETIQVALIQSAEAE
jgi:hypothetical protein